MQIDDLYSEKLFCQCCFGFKNIFLFLELEFYQFTRPLIGWKPLYSVGFEFIQGFKF